MNTFCRNYEDWCKRIEVLSQYFLFQWYNLLLFTEDEMFIDTWICRFYILLIFILSKIMSHCTLNFYFFLWYPNVVWLKSYVKYNVHLYVRLNLHLTRTSSNLTSKWMFVYYIDTCKILRFPSQIHTSMSPSEIYTNITHSEIRSSISLWHYNNNIKIKNVNEHSAIDEK